MTTLSALPFPMYHEPIAATMDMLADRGDDQLGLFVTELEGCSAPVSGVGERRLGRDGLELTPDDGSLQLLSGP